MQINKESTTGNKNPLFLKFINREIDFTSILSAFANSPDKRTSEIAVKAMENPIDLDPFREELEGAVRDIISKGLGEEFKSFVNHYMETSLAEEYTTTKGPLGEGRVQIATIKDENEPWVQGFICYNLCLYIKAFGLQDLKACKVCNKVFSNKGKYALYCSDQCKNEKGSHSVQKGSIYRGGKV